MLSVLFAALALGSSPLQAAAPQARPAAPVVQVDASGAAAPQAEPETRRVCRYETATGSNRRNRVCRDVPRHGVQDQATQEYMRQTQRVRIPDVH